MGFFVYISVIKLHFMIGVLGPANQNNGYTLKDHGKQKNKKCANTSQIITWKI